MRLLVGALTVLARATLAEQDLDLVLYGATGCVGHFAAQHLAGVAGLRWAVAGRDEKKLQDLIASLGTAPASKPEAIVAPLEVGQDPATWLRRTKAVVTAAGPFSVHNGEVLVEAAARLGVHYADTSDEFYWQRRMVDRHDAAARASGARVVLSGGFCALAGDLGAQLAMAGAPAGEEVHVDEWLEKYNGGVSAGVLNTARAIKNASYPSAWNDDPYVLAPEAPTALRLDTSITGVKTLDHDPAEGVVTQNVFGPYDARLLRRTFTKRSQRVHFRSGAPPSMYAKWTAFLAAHPGSWTKLTKCPTAAVYEGGSWAMRVRATAAGGWKREVLLEGEGDPGYKFTAQGLAETGLCLAGVTPDCLLPGGAGGVLTTMSAMHDAAVQRRLQAVGLLNVSFPAVAGVDAHALVV